MDVEQLLKQAVDAGAKEAADAKALKEITERYALSAHHHHMAVQRLVDELRSQLGTDGKPNVFSYRGSLYEIYLGALNGRSGWMIRPLDIKVIGHNQGNDDGE